MSGRHPKRTRCVSCSNPVRGVETIAALRVKVNQSHFWEFGRAVICPPCREAWWAPFQLPLWPDDELEDQELPSEAPVWHAQPRISASWPRTSSRASRDRRLSVLVGSTSSP